jgi:chromosome segregation ATPase
MTQRDSDRSTFQTERQTWQEKMDAAATRAEATLASLTKSKGHVNELRTVSESLTAERTILQKSIEDNRTESASTIDGLQNTNQRLQQDLNDAKTKIQDLMELLAEALEREQAAISRVQALLRDLTTVQEREGKLLEAGELRILIDSLFR